MFKKRFTFTLLSRAEDTKAAMSPSERWLFYFFALTLLLSTLALIGRVYTNITIVAPSNGGKIVEGVIGAPRFVNPVLAISQTDKDLVELLYGSLMTLDAQGNLIPELAESYSVSEDAKTYTFVLQEGLSFHDGTPLTADDVVFTIEKAVEPGIKSPERANWEGVTVTQVDDYTVTFSLSKPYAQFLENTLLGILPEEHWGKLTADEFIFSNLNTAPIGSGPYKFVSATHDTSGIPDSFALTKFKDYVRGTPFINKITLNFYSGKSQIEEALARGEVTSMSEVSPYSVSEMLSDKKHTVFTATLPRIFAVFFNQSHNEVLADASVRRILRDVIDKDALITNILDGYATQIDSPILTNKDIYNTPDATVAILTPEEARAELEEDGWELDEGDGLLYKGGVPLALTLTTANSAELKDMATEITNAWTAIGVRVKLEIFEPGNLAQSVLRTREYDALLFGEIVGTEPDPYAFWHSSQRNDPGLNIANYANTQVDNLLVEARKTIDNEARADLYVEAVEAINDDIPAIFLYAPHFIYLTDPALLSINLAPMVEPHDRFNNVHLWHINNNRVLFFRAK
jgi:peptide/nickel transport system substrate-binding protein